MHIFYECVKSVPNISHVNNISSGQFWPHVFCLTVSNAKLIVHRYEWPQWSVHNGVQQQRLNLLF